MLMENSLKIPTTTKWCLSPNLLLTKLRWFQVLERFIENVFILLATG